MEKKTRRPRRRFSEEFKREAVELADKIGITKASRELDVDVATVRHWRKKQKPQTDESGNKRPYSELEKENRRLAKEIGYLREINRVLKKSTAIFSSEQLGGLK